MSEGQQEIDCANGANELTDALTITQTSTPLPIDISSATIELALALVRSNPATGDWRAPDFNQTASSAIDPDTGQPTGVPVYNGDTLILNQRIVALRVSPSLGLPTGTYVLWSRITSSPDVVPRPNRSIFITAPGASGDQDLDYGDSV